MAPPARTITVALDMSKVIDTIKIHTLIRKLLQTTIPGTIIKFIAHYIKVRKGRHNIYKSHILTTSIQNWRSFTNIYTADIPPPRAPVQFMAYADHHHIYTHKQEYSQKCIQPYLHTVFAWTKQNNLTLNPDKTTCTLFTPDPAEYKSNLEDYNKHHCTMHGNAPKGSGPYLRPKTHTQHIHSQHLSTSTQATTNDKSTHNNRMG